MVPTTTPAVDEPEQLVRRLVASCTQAGLTSVILVPNEALRVTAPGADVRMAETITLRRDGRAAYRWYWSWGDPISAHGAVLGAHETHEAVKVIAHVVAAGVS
ncbi:MAG: hypothetical protein ACREMY_08355 [bacterium]